jgi:hypothetical protein
MIAIGPCWTCKKQFEFHPDFVASVIIDPATRLPMDHPDAGNGPGEKVPLCPDCCRLINVERANRGLALLDERDSLDVYREWIR